MHGPDPGSIQQRREAVTSSVGAPVSYDARAREVVATLSKGSPVKRSYGTEVLRISPQAIDLSRMQSGSIPLLDHHRQDGIDSILGRITDAWIAGGALMGRLKFAETERGQLAEGMISRGEIGAVSVGYRVTEWSVTNADGDEIDPDRHPIAWDDDDLTFTATRWQLFEVSLVGVPADGAALVRALSHSHGVLTDIRARMASRARMVKRMGQLRHELAGFRRTAATLFQARAAAVVFLRDRRRNATESFDV